MKKKGECVRKNRTMTIKPDKVKDRKGQKGNKRKLKKKKKGRMNIEKRNKTIISSLLCTEVD